MSEDFAIPKTTGSPARILVIDDELQIRKFLDISLRAQGYRVEVAGTGASGIAAFVARDADLVILDLGLPDRDGHSVLAELRRRSPVPVILLTVRSSESEQVAALDAGASDYVTKPFGVQELMARVRALLRSTTAIGEAPTAFDDGRLRVDFVRREVCMAGEAVTLTRKEYALLALLIQHVGRVVTQPQLLRAIWGPTHQDDTHYLRILVAKLRHKLGDDASAPTWIATEPGVGLRFIARNRVDQ